MIIGFTSVVGDMMHAGHCLMLEECKRHCDYLFVGIIADPTTDRPEKHRPVQSLFERYAQVVSNGNVDEVIPLSGEKDLELALRSLPIDIRFVGEDYRGKDFTGKEYCLERGIRIYYNRRDHGLSSTELRRRVKDAELCGRDPDLQEERPSTDTPVRT